MKQKSILGKSILAGVLCLSLFSASAMPVFAAQEVTEEKQTLSYEKAYELAIKNNTTLDSLVASLETTQANRKSFFDGTLETKSNSSFVLLDEQVYGYLSSLRSYDNAISNGQLQQDITKVAIGASVKSSFAQVQILEKSLKLAQENYSIQKKQLSFGQKKSDLGLISSNDLEQLKRETTEMEQNIKKIEISLDDAYLALNRLIGRPAKDRYVIENDISHEALKMDMSIDAYVTRSISTDASLKIEKNKIDTAKFSKTVVTQSTTISDVRNAELAYDESERGYKEAKQKKEESIRSTYNKLLELEAERVTLEKALEKAKQDFSTAEVNFKVGNITQLQLEQAKLAVENAEMNLLNNALTHDITKYSFENTCILS
jgi:outer membrane protein TolC